MLLVLFLLTRRPPVRPPPTEVNPAVVRQTRQGPETPLGAEAASPTQLEISARALKADPSRSNELIRATQEAYAKAIKLHPGQMLANVNGVPITLRDLIAIDPSESSETEHSMSEDAYKYLLDRAIKRELAFQAAQQQGIQLSQQQQAQLDQIDRTARSRDEDPDTLARLNTPASREAQIEFEKRDAAGLLMQEALLEHSGGPSPHVTEDQVKQYYQQNIQLYGQLPSDPGERDVAWRRIDAQIRTDLRYSTLQAHQDALDDYMKGLKAAANVQISDVKTGGSGTSQ